jgi:thioredoxin-like negative regulator of GroEL
MNLETANLNLPIEVVDIDAHPEVAQEYGIRSVPTLVMLDENIEFKRLIGSKTVNQLQEWAND